MLLSQIAIGAAGNNNRKDSQGNPFHDPGWVGGRKKHCRTGVDTSREGSISLRATVLNQAGLLVVWVGIHKN